MFFIGMVCLWTLSPEVKLEHIVQCNKQHISELRTLRFVHFVSIGISFDRSFGQYLRFCFVKFSLLLFFLLLVMSYPADGIESTYKNNIDDVRSFLDSKYPENYLVINVSPRTYRTEKLSDRVSSPSFYLDFLSVTGYHLNNPLPPVSKHLPCTTCDVISLMSKDDLLISQFSVIT